MATSKSRGDAANGQTSFDDALDGGEHGYGGPQVCKIVGITYRQLDYWDRRDLVKPSLAEARGSGTQRLYSYRDLLRLKVIKNLLDAGLRLEAARRAIQYLRGDLGDDWQKASLVLDGSDSVLVRKDDELVDALRHGQGVLNVVLLGRVAGEIDASIHELAPRDEPVVASGDADRATGTR